MNKGEWLCAVDDDRCCCGIIVIITATRPVHGLRLQRNLAVVFVLRRWRQRVFVHGAVVDAVRQHVRRHRRHVAVHGRPAPAVEAVCSSDSGRAAGPWHARRATMRVLAVVVVLLEHIIIHCSSTLLRLA
jgi:hypothetical protein